MSDKAKTKYTATLSDREKHGDPQYSTEIWASSDAEAWDGLLKWAREECLRHNLVKAWLQMVDSASVSRSELIDLTR
jgi:hypothetical protein